MGLDPAVGSHLPWFKQAVETCDGPVLELGGGWFSSPVVHEAFLAGRTAFTYEWDHKWAEELRSCFSQPIVTDFAELPRIFWDVVLVDCEGWSRNAFVAALRKRTGIFIVHDSQDPWITEETLNTFRFREDYESDPRTTVVSDIRRLT